MKTALITGAFGVVAAVVGASITVMATSNDAAPSSTTTLYSATTAGTESGGPNSTSPSASTTPAAGGPAARIVYLSDLPIVEQRIGEPGSATITGKTYPHSVILNPNNFDQTGWASFDLGGHYTRLRATVGMPADNHEGINLPYEIYADGQSVKKGTIGLLRGVPIDINVKGVQRLKIATTLPVDFNSVASYELKVAYGDAILTVDSANPPEPTTSI
jgi:hypothetical protein